VLFHPDNAQVYSSGSDNKVRRWPLATAKQAAELGLGGEGYKLAGEGEFFVTASAEQKVRQVNAKDLKVVREYAGAKDWVLCAALHNGTKRVAGGAFDGEVLVWNAEDGKVVTQFLAAPGYIPAK
jgi:WD40 repeat protein